MRYEVMAEAIAWNLQEYHSISWDFPDYVFLNDNAYENHLVQMATMSGPTTQQEFVSQINRLLNEVVE